MTEEKHIVVNGYANGWEIESEKNNERQHFILELANQRIFYFSALTSVLSLIVLSAWCVLMYVRGKTIIKE